LECGAANSCLSFQTLEHSAFNLGFGRLSPESASVISCLDVYVSCHKKKEKNRLFHFLSIFVPFGKIQMNFTSSFLTSQRKIPCKKQPIVVFDNSDQNAMCYSNT
jgi:hypothetical protein